MNTIRWNTTGNPLVVEYAPALLEELAAAAMLGFRRSAAGGTEIGGLLLGRRDGDRITLLAQRPLSCEHAEGPAFRLSSADEGELVHQLRQENQILQVLGWYHSHFWDLALDKAALDLHNRYFPEPWQIALVLKRARQQPVQIALFLRQSDGSVKVAAEQLTVDIDAPRLLPPAVLPPPIRLSTDKLLPALLEAAAKCTGIMAITAIPDAGKTDFLLRLGDQLQQRSRVVALLLDPPVTAQQFYEMLTDDLDIHCSSRTRHHLKTAFQSFLQGRPLPVVLLLDQAHRISDEVLRELLALGSLADDAGQKPLQIVLAGRPEFNERLASPNLADLLRAVASHYALIPDAESCRDAAIREQLA